jgi:hypothetical protein
MPKSWMTEKDVVDLLEEGVYLKWDGVTTKLVLGSSTLFVPENPEVSKMGCVGMELLVNTGKIVIAKVHFQKPENEDFLGFHTAEMWVGEAPEEIIKINPKYYDRLGGVTSEEKTLMK